MEVSVKKVRATPEAGEGAVIIARCFFLSCLLVPAPSSHMTKHWQVLKPLPDVSCQGYLL